jgi:hypothetical protein
LWTYRQALPLNIDERVFNSDSFSETIHSKSNMKGKLANFDAHSYLINRIIAA